MRANSAAVGCLVTQLLLAGFAAAQTAPRAPAPRQPPPSGTFAPDPAAPTPPPPAPAAPPGAAPPGAAPPAPGTPPPNSPGGAPPELPPGPPPAMTPPPGSAPPAEVPPPASVPAPAAGRPIYEPPPPPVPAPDPTIQRHDGFYLRLGLGGGLVRSRVESSVEFGDLSARGAGLALDLALGGTVADGLVIGGGIYLVGMNSVTWSGDSLSREVEGNTGGIGLIGVMVDYYPDSRGGFHVLGALGIGSLNYERDNDELPTEDWNGGGGGALLGVGYEAWIGDQWSLGGVVRALVVSGTLRGDETDDDMDATGFAPAILFVATHH